MEEDGESHDYGHALVFICIALLLVVGVYELRKLIKLPASLLLVSTGLFLRYAGVYIGQIEGAVDIWSEVDQWSVLLFFLPALIFECGFSIDWYSFKRQLPQILLMSSTAVVMHTFLVALTLKLVLQYDMDWDQYFMIGVLLSATDHVTVVSLLKEMKVGKRFATLIQGETLLIDGSVMVLFFVMYRRITGETVEDGDTAIHFFRLTFGGLVLGVAFCIAFTFAVKRIVNDEVSEVNMTVITSYLIFFTAEDSGIAVSGAISTVTFGLFMAAYGKTQISPTVEHSLHFFWRIVGKDIEGIIFIVVGIVIGEISLTTEAVTLNDVWKSVVLFLLLHFIRGLVVLVHYPLLSKSGLGLNWKEAVLLTVAGAKGVISSSLSLIIWHNKEIAASFRDLSLFIVVLCSSLSIFFDSFIVWAVMKSLGLGRISEAESHSLLQVAQTIVEANDKLARKLRSRYDQAQWTAVESLSGTRQILSTVISQTKEGKAFLNEKGSNVKLESAEAYCNSISLTENQLLQEVRRRTLLAYKGLYWKNFEKGLVLGQNALLLMESADSCLEKLKAKVEDWNFLYKSLIKSPSMHPRFNVRLPFMDRLFNYLNFRRLANSYDIANCYIAVHEEVKHEAEYILKNVDLSIIKQINEEVEDQLNQAKLYKELFENHEFVEVVSYIQTKQAASAMLNLQRNHIKEYHEQGVIDDFEKDLLIEVVDKNYSKLRAYKRPQALELAKLLKSTQLVKGLTDYERKLLIGLCSIANFSADQTIFDPTSKAEGMYFILEGRVEESSPHWGAQFNVGEAVGELNMLPEVDNPLTTAVAQTETLAVFLPKNTEALNLIGTPCMESLAVKYIASSTEYLDKSLKKQKLKLATQIVRNSYLKRYYEGDTVSMPTGGFLIYGDLDNRGGTYFPPQSQETQIFSNVCFIHFNPELSQALAEFDGNYYEALKSLDLQSCLVSPAEESKLFEIIGE